MDTISFACPRCGASHYFHLSRDSDRHLRQCPDCDCWFVAHEDPEAGSGYRVERLADPPTCPVAGCGETVPSDRLPPHIVENHDGF